MIFTILFGDPYAISLTFLIILILWVFIGLKAGQLLEALGILKRAGATVAGFVFTILLAQTTLLRTLAKLCLDIILSSANWWMRLITVIFFVVFFFVLSYLISLVSKKIKEGRAAKKEGKLDEKVEEVESITKGLKG